MIQSMTENYRRLELNLKSNTKEFIKIINYVVSAEQTENT